MSKQNDKLIIPLIVLASVLVPTLVSLLIMSNQNEDGNDCALSFLAGLNAGINSGVFLLLLTGLYFIKQKKIDLHRLCMGLALGLSILFLVSYLTYHYTCGHVSYGGEGMLKTIYLLILFTHIVLSVAIVPLALLTVYRGWTTQIEKHRKIAKWTLPLWLYVSFTGVVVYLMAHPFNPGE